ncbi:MAG: DUF4159 domain-containing protein [candidate division KSB1 bacterium]|nr:DUF4159 domain-containing protein [candidate division KSB1 bacterium]
MRLHYRGGGDWYNNPSIIPNLLEFIDKQTIIQTREDEVQLSIMDDRLFSYPVLFMTGHGRVVFSPEEVKHLRDYLTNGGFLYADDDYGMQEHFFREMHKVFPDRDFHKVPFSHQIFHFPFEFSNGLPKIHEFDGGPPEAFGYFDQGRLIVFYTSNTNISDGWADPDVHNDPEAVRLQALQMGVNIMMYALTR